MRTKLTMVSVWYDGKRQTVFIPLPVDYHGKAILSAYLRKLLGIPVGTTFAIGA